MAMTPQDSIIHLQKTIGNQAVQMLMRSNPSNNGTKSNIQTKLKISQPGDVYEQEADRIAEQIMRMPSKNQIASPILTNKEERINRKCSSCKMKKKKEEEESLHISRKPSASSDFETSSEAQIRLVMFAQATAPHLITIPKSSWNQGLSMILITYVFTKIQKQQSQHSR